MSDSDVNTERSTQEILETVRRFWGFETLRPLQEDAIRAGLEQRDSLVVMPTGGGKSLCYQVPAAIENRTDIVVSPLISLMKDQVDGLRACGYPAAAMYSGLAFETYREIERELLAGRYRLIFVAPERLLTPGFLRLIERIRVGAFAIDEAHCISHWGHDFRPEYRRLAELKQRFPKAGVHAFTATATERVRRDIVEQLHLKDPALLVGSFDRPNLTYRIVPRTDVYTQALEVLTRHKNEAVIVYCITRRDTEGLAMSLQDAGLRAAHYHAGMDAEDRRRTQDAFAREELDVIVATVAFGMGIDRSDVRCVLHTAMPKSVEHYQQETGRAGRDGLGAECVLLYSAADPMRWEGLLEKSAEKAEAPPEVIQAALALLREMRRFSVSTACRHRALVEYFGQAYEPANCEACDCCLGEIEGVEDGTVTAQKILSCVARVEQRFGVGHVVDVLTGADTERVRSFRHHALSTYGLMKGAPKDTIKRQVYELLDQGLLSRAAGEYPVLNLNDASWEVMRGQRTVMMRKPEQRVVKASHADRESWEDVDRGLFDDLRELRRELAEERGVPAYVVFSDAVLRDMARLRPTDHTALIEIRGVGKRKLEDFGQTFADRIGEYCTAHGVATDEAPASTESAGTQPVVSGTGQRVSASMRRAFKLFADGASIENVMQTMERARSTTTGYLAEYIARERPESIDRWVDAETYARVVAEAEKLRSRRLKPIHDRLRGEVPYDTIRLVAAHLHWVDQPPIEGGGE